MMTVARLAAALVLAAAMLNFAQATPSSQHKLSKSGGWVLAAPEQSCSQVCGVASPCNAAATEAANDAFNNDPAYFTTFMQSEFGVTCKGIETAAGVCNGVIGPYFNSVLGKCGTALWSRAAVDCDATCGRSIQRVCCCGANCALPPTPTPTPSPTPFTPSSPNAGWVLQQWGMSCTWTCGFKGVASDSSRPTQLNRLASTNPAAFESVMNTIPGVNCQGTADCTDELCNGYAPARADDGTCIHSSIQDLAFDCKEPQSGLTHRRICCCGLPSDCPIEVDGAPLPPAPPLAGWIHPTCAESCEQTCGADVAQGSCIQERIEELNDLCYPGSGNAAQCAQALQNIGSPCAGVSSQLGCTDPWSCTGTAPMRLIGDFGDTEVCYWADRQVFPLDCKASPPSAGFVFGRHCCCGSYADCAFL